MVEGVCIIMLEVSGAFNHPKRVPLSLFVISIILTFYLFRRLSWRLGPGRAAAPLGFFVLFCKEVAKFFGKYLVAGLSIELETSVG